MTVLKRILIQVTNYRYPDFFIKYFLDLQKVEGKVLLIWRHVSPMMLSFCGNDLLPCYMGARWSSNAILLPQTYPHVPNKRIFNTKWRYARPVTPSLCSKDYPLVPAIISFVNTQVRRPGRHVSLYLMKVSFWIHDA